MGVSSSKHRRRKGGGGGGLCEGKKVMKEEEGGMVMMSEKAMMVYERVSRENAKATTYEKEMMAFAFKKAEWKQERRKLKEEVRVLRALVEEKEEIIREMKEDRERVGDLKGHDGNTHLDYVDGDDDDDDSKNMKCGVFLGMNNEKWGGFLGAHHDFILVDQIRELERARRDETIEKWKQLYLAIKMELDDLIQRTHEGGLYWKEEEEDIAEELKKGLEAKEETIKELKSRLASMEQQMFKRDREADILRQSLRIISSNTNYPPKKLPLQIVK